MPDCAKINTTSDEQLIRATLGGDISSFGIIVERYWDMSAAFALSKVKNTSDAEDIAQESFIKAGLRSNRAASGLRTLSR